MFVTAFMLGLAGSLHCAGMCSPLLMAVTNKSSSAIWSRIIYNGGRIFTYGLLGSFVSGAGTLLSLSSFQSSLSITTGIFIIVAAMTGISRFQIPWLSKTVRAFANFIRERFTFLMNKKHPVGTFLMGTLNGLLPCGMTLLALSSCAMLTSPKDGFGFMVMFGAGTLPVMLGFASFVLFGINRLHLNLSKVTTALMIASGMILIGRGFTTHGIEPAILSNGIVICR